MSKKLEHLKEQEAKLTNELRLVANQISEIEDKEVIPKLKAKYEGRYFKFRNSYSCPKVESDYWFTYFKVEEIKSTTKVLTKTFQVDSEGVIQIDCEHKTSISLLAQEITPLEYNEALRRTLDMIDLA